MTNQEAIKELEWVKERGFVADKGIIGTDRIGEAVRMAIKALDKQIPKKPIEVITSDNKFERDVCGNCEHIYGVYQYYDFCPYCGNRIDWSEVE